MQRSDAVTLGLVFMIVALLAALVAFTKISDGQGMMKEVAMMAFFLFLADSVVHLVRAATAPAIRRRDRP